MEIEPINFEGYLVIRFEDGVVVKSRHTINGHHVFGPDSDFTTMAITGMNFLSKELDLSTVNIDSNVEQAVMQASGYSIDSESPYSILTSTSEASLTITKGADFNVNIKGEESDPELVKNLNNAWETEMESVSQGAFVSEHSYFLGVDNRIGLLSQKVGEGYVWPPRESIKSTEGDTRISKSGIIESWTKLSAGGAPSEFSIRAPLLGSISTVFLRLKEGPCGVFLVADDEKTELKIGEEVNLVVRKIYAQEGLTRYGLKAIIPE